jgi:hypothetical protein
VVSARRVGPPLALVLLVTVSTAIRSLAALQVPSPWFVPDEIVYATLGESLIRLGHFEVLGSTPDFFGLVYPALVGLPLVLAGLESGYELLKPLQAVVMSLTAVPVYLWGRSVMRPAYALVAAALTLSLPGLAYAGFLMTEVAFYPVATLAAWAMARALVRPTLAAQALVLAALVAAVLTRLQAAALVGVLVVALVLKLWFTREGLRGLRPFAPLAGGLAAIAATWAVATTLRGGRFLGAYAVAGEETAPLADSARFVLYHAADLLLLTALIPILALAVLLWNAALGRERSSEAAALLAVAVALALVSVAQVGVFAAMWVGHMAERNLLAVAPPVFLAFSLWLDRGAPRAPVAPVVFVAALALVAVVPWDELATAAAIPDALSVVPFSELEAQYPATSLHLTVVCAAITLATAWLLVPRRFAWTLSVLVVALLAGSSVASSRLTADRARVFQTIMVGEDKRWIDHATAEPVGLLHAGEQGWSAGAPVWMNLFWNHRIDRVYRLFRTRIAGPLEPDPVSIGDDGRLMLEDGRRADVGYLAASGAWSVRGRRIASSSAGYHLWRVARPLRLSTRVAGARVGDAVLSPRARLTVYDCTGGHAEIALLGLRDLTVELRTRGLATRRIRVRAARTWEAAVPITPLPSRRVCELEIVGGHTRLTWFRPKREA